MGERQYQPWQSIDGLSFVEVYVAKPEPPYPALITIEPDYLASMLPDDARSLAAVLSAAADEADRYMASRPKEVRGK